MYQKFKITGKFFLLKKKYYLMVFLLSFYKKKKTKQNSMDRWIINVCKCMVKSSELIKYTLRLKKKH